MIALDLFCGAGGASLGLHRVGFTIIGVDIEPQPDYPFSFVQADALKLPFDLRDFDLVWASPPCQAYTKSKTRAKVRKEHPKLIADVRKMLVSARAWVIENVPGAPLGGTMLCGGQFGLGAIGPDGKRRSLARHRLFETSWPILSPGCRCDRRQKIGVYGYPEGDVHGHGYKGRLVEWREAMEMNGKASSLAEAIPPAYSEWIGKNYLNWS